MQVPTSTRKSDSSTTTPHAGCTTTVYRQIFYEVHNFSGSTTNLAYQPLGENASTSVSTCTPQQTAVTTSCSAGISATDAGGNFEDDWTLGTDNLSPSGCGVTVNYDHWQMCFNGHPKTFGTISGYVHTNETEVNGHIVPPNSGEMSPGTRIDP